MMSDQSPFRALLFIEALVACLLYAQLVGILWRGDGWNLRRPFMWAVRTTLVGLGGVFVYVTAGQIKAVQRDSPFDVYAWIGLAGVTVLDIGLAWMWEQRRHERG